MKTLLDQFRDRIASKPADKLQELRVELLTKSVGGGEQGPVERGAALAYVAAIDDEILHRAGVASSSSAKAEYDQAEDVKRVGVQPATTTRAGLYREGDHGRTERERWP